MAMDFPNSPTTGQTYSVAGGPTYSYDGTKWRVLTPGNQFNRTAFTATAGQTVFSVTYTLGAVDVFQNGVKLVSGSDFTATNGTSITLANAATVGDTIEVIAYSQVVYATAAKAEDVYSVVRGMKNRIINGDMRIDQRNAGAAVTVNTTNNFYPVDRFNGVGENTDGVYTLQQLTSNPPSTFTHYIRASVTTADASIGSGQRYSIIYKSEGNTIADFDFGLATAKPVTLSFYVRSSVTGTFSGSLRNGAGTRSYPFSYTISAANTWELKTITIPGDTTGTWAIDNTTGFFLSFDLGSGSSLRAAAGSWAAGDYRAATGAVSLISTLSATFDLTGVQLEAGTVTNPVFERRPYGLELSLCQRYYQRISVSARGYCQGATYSTGGALTFFPMRAAPTWVRVSGPASSLNTYSGAPYGDMTVHTNSSGYFMVQAAAAGDVYIFNLVFESSGTEL